MVCIAHHWQDQQRNPLDRLKLHCQFLIPEITVIGIIILCSNVLSIIMNMHEPYKEGLYCICTTLYALATT